MDLENVVIIHNGSLLSHKDEILSFANKIDGTGEHHLKQSQSNSEGQNSHVLPYTWILELKQMQ
jgi:hypothetical protein